MNTNVAEIKNLNLEQLNVLADEIRSEINESVSKNGGHLSSNLGIVELMIAVHRVFDTPKDKVIFDVGHQCYAHKILTGRLDGFKNLRHSNGVSGFPKTQESNFDTFNTGHASTAISLSCGLMRARRLKGEGYKIVSIVGDGAFCGGETFEALNDLAAIDGQLLIILNDNSMTISKTEGEIVKSEDNLASFLTSVGIRYLGSVDGHNLNDLLKTLEYAKSCDGHYLLRVVTQKGKGNNEAMSDSEKFHSVALGEVKTFGSVVGEKLNTMAFTDKNIVAVTAAMTDAVGLRSFKCSFPDRLYDVGIAEEHAVSMAAGLAKGGLIPFVCIYSSFLQRAYDQILQDVSLQKLPVKFLIDRSGFVDGDGDTHQGIYDIDYLLPMPNLTLLSPTDEVELRRAMDMAVKIDGPVAIRYTKYNFEQDFTVNYEQPHVDIVCTSNVMLKLGKNISKKLGEIGILASVKSAFNLSRNIVSKAKLVVILEDSNFGGYYKSIASINDKVLGYYVGRPDYVQADLDEIVNANFNLNKIVDDIRTKIYEIR
ncbi:MAG: 1-deoxy-D-xylulose-5-phosphate synthase [Christensenellales bacterium]